MMFITGIRSIWFFELMLKQLFLRNKLESHIYLLLINISDVNFLSAYSQ